MLTQECAHSPHPLHQQNFEIPCWPLRDTLHTSLEPWPWGNSHDAVTHKGASSEVGPWRVPSPLRPKTGASALPCSTALTDLPQAPSGSAPPFLLSVSLWAYAKTTGQWGASGGIRGLTEAPSGRRCTVVAKETRGPGAARWKQGAGQKRACSRGSAPRTSAPPSSSRLPLGTPLGFFPSPSPSVLGTERAHTASVLQ